MNSHETYVQYRKDAASLNTKLKRPYYPPIPFKMFKNHGVRKVTGRPTLVTTTKWWKPFQKLEWAVDSWWEDKAGNVVTNVLGSLRFVNVID